MSWVINEDSGFVRWGREICDIPGIEQNRRLDRIRKDEGGDVTICGRCRDQRDDREAAVSQQRGSARGAAARRFSK